MDESLWCGLSFELPVIELSGDTGAPHISPIQLCREGRWEHPKFGLLEFNRARFQRFIDGFEARIRGIDLALDVEHIPTDGAAGWFVPVSMRMQDTDKGLGLFVDITWTPRGLQLVRDREYPYVSLTFKPSWTDPETGRVHEDVVFGAALTTDPFIKGMQPVQLSEPRGNVVMLSEFSEINEGEVPMAQTAESMRTDQFLSGKMQECPDCSGTGKSDGDGGKAACTLCDGKGRIPVPGNSDTSLSEAAANPREAAIKKSQAEEKPGVQLDDDTGGGDGGDDVEALAEDFRQKGEALAAKLKGKTGSPMIRQHMKATHQLIGPVIDKMKGEPTQMSETTTANAQPNEVMVQLNRRLAELESQNQKDAEDRKRMAAELEQQRQQNATLLRDRQRTEVVKLTENWFPRQGQPGFRCAGSMRNEVTELLMALHDADASRNEQLVELSNGAALADTQKSKLLDRVVALVNSVPEPQVLNLTSHALSQLDPEADITDEPTRLREETVRLSEKEKISYGQAARRIADQQRKTRR